MYFAQTQPQLTLVSIVNFIGAAQAFFLALVLFAQPQGRRQANLLLGACLICLAAFIIEAVLYESSYLLRFPHLYGVSAPFTFAVAPLFYLFICAVVDESLAIRASMLAHFTPAGLIALMSTPEFLQSADEKIAAYKEEFAATQPTVAGLILLLILDVLILTYLVLSLRKILDAGRRREKTEADGEQESTQWLKHLVAAFLVIAAISTVFDLLSLNLQNSRVTPLLLTLVVYGMGYAGLRQSRVFGLLERRAATRKYEKSNLSEEQSAVLYERLTKLMERDKVFTDSALTLPRLARMLNASSHHLSQVINARCGQNFFAFISDHRIAEAQRRLQQDKTSSLTISEIAHSVGFNSISAFNTAFKKKYLISPSQYRRQRPG